MKLQTLKKWIPGWFLLAAGAISLLMAAKIYQQPDHSQATVSQLQGLYVFTDATPLAPYEYLGSVQNGTRLAGSSQYQPVRDRLIKKLKQEYPAANGVIFHFVNNAPDKADAIKFK